jgi:hypothetical protein
LEHINPVFWAIAILSSASCFTFFWLLDARTHKALVKIDITDKELQTHRNILVTSLLMEASLVGMFWYQIELLPFFIAFFITRTAQEFIDELHFHTDRCTVYESRLHLGMWISVLSKTVLMFMWGFFTGYEGVLELHPALYVWAAIVFGAMSVISYFEWRR